MKLPALQSYLQEHHIDLAILVHPDINITYFSQQKLSYGYLIITPKKAILYHTQLDTPPAIPHITKKLLKKNWEKALSPSHIKTIAINKESLTLSSFDRLKSLFPKAKVHDLSPYLKELRTTKTPKELLYLKKACDISTHALKQTLLELKKHTLKTEQDVALFIEKKIREQGGDIAFPTIIAMGANAATPHHATSLAPLKSGFLLFDFGASYNHYCADISRTIYLGTPSTQEHQLYTLLQQSQQDAINAISPHTLLTDLDKTARKTLGKYSKYFIHSLGHGLGLEIHESPSFLPKLTIQPNIPFTIEPGIYLKNRLGIRIEDTLYWDKKTHILTQFPKHLIIIH